MSKCAACIDEQKLYVQLSGKKWDEQSGVGEILWFTEAHSLFVAVKLSPSFYCVTRQYHLTLHAEITVTGFLLIPHS